MHAAWMRVCLSEGTSVSQQKNNGRHYAREPPRVSGLTTLHSVFIMPCTEVDSSEDFNVTSACLDICFSMTS